MKFATAFALLAFSLAAQTETVTISDMGSDVLVQYGGCEVTSFEWVPNQPEFSNLLATCEEVTVTGQMKRLEPAPRYVPFGRVGLMYQGKLFSSSSCNMISMFKLGNDYAYYFQCFSEEE